MSRIDANMQGGCVAATPPAASTGFGVRTMLAVVGGLPRAVVRTLYTWQRRAHERRHLASLDERLLRDMGLSRHDVAEETAKPFWRD